jgi:hypothetical protein
VTGKDAESPGDVRVSMHNWNQFYGYPVVIHSIGDKQLPRPVTIFELLVSILTGLILAFRVFGPLLGGTWALAVFIVTVFFMPGLVATAAGACGRKLHREMFAWFRFYLLSPKLYAGARPARSMESTRMRRMFASERRLAGVRKQEKAKELFALARRALRPPERNRCPGTGDRLWPFRRREKRLAREAHAGGPAGPPPTVKGGVY